MSTPSAVITGAAGGIGRVLAHRLASDGWRLHLIDITSEGLATLQTELPDATICESTLDTPEACTAALPEGEITALIHLAGVFIPHEMDEKAREIYDATIQHNATNAFDLCNAALTQIAEGGRIVLTASLAFNRGVADHVAYGMAKGAVVGLTRSLARLLGPRGICVNALAPGIVETQMPKHLYERRGGLEKIEASIPLGRIGQPEDITGVIAFLLSKDAGYITGQLLNVDGGVVNG